MTMTSRKTMLVWRPAMALLTFLALSVPGVLAQEGPLPSWNDGPAKRAIIAFVSAVTTPSSPDFVPQAERIVTFDMDGTLWVEQPVYPEIVFAFDRLAARARTDAALAAQQPLRSLLANGPSALRHLSFADSRKLLRLAMSGMTVEAFNAEVQGWLAAARQACWDAPHTRLAYQPMVELMAFFQSHGFKTFIVTGSSQDFARSFAADVLGLPPEQVIGTARLPAFAHDKYGEPHLIAGPDVMIDVIDSGKPEAIHLFIGQRPIAAFGNSGGDADMLEYVSARKGRSLAMLVLHDDGEREYAYGPALGLPDTGVGVFNQALYDRALKSGWHVISMRNEWREVLAGLEKPEGPEAASVCAPH